MRWIITGIIINYLIGSIPTAYIFGKLLKGIDIRNFGSGNVGATNALRVLGKRVGALVLALDILKGVVPVFLAQAFISKTSFNPDILRLLFGVSCISGHNWTVFLGFKGGKGIATTLGVLIGLALKIPGLGIILLILVLSWVFIFIWSRYVSLASITSAILLPVLTILFKQSRIISLAGFLFAFFVLIRHKSNIIRLLSGKETKLTFGKKVN